MTDNARQTKEKILSELHELVGLCGHCGKRSCAGRKTSSFLPANIPYESVIEAINKALNEELTIDGFDLTIIDALERAKNFVSGDIYRISEIKRIG